MPASPDPPFPPNQQGISLDELAAAFAEVMGVEPRRSDDAPIQTATPATETSPAEAGVDAAGPVGDAVVSPAETATGEEAEAKEPDEDAACPLGPQSILEAMLFVGNRENEPLSPGRAADLMRGVQPDEIPSLVDALNRSYAKGGTPYQIVCEGSGYRLVLRRELQSMQSRFFGKVREARLSQPTIDVLALVAYQQPITGDKIKQLRGKPCDHILAHLVRRGLLRIERPDPKKRTPHYYTTDRFLKLFNLQSLDDLPRSLDPEPM